MKRIITDRDLESLAVDGVVHISRDMILTPFAKDFAVNNAIRLEYETDSTD